MFSNDISTIKERYSPKFIYLVINPLQEIGNFRVTNRGGPMSFSLSVSASVTSFSQNLIRWKFLWNCLCLCVSRSVGQLLVSLKNNLQDFSKILYEVSGLKGSKIDRAKFFRNHFVEKAQKCLQNKFFLAFAENLIYWCVFFYSKNGA